MPIYIGLDVGERYALGVTAFHRPSNNIRRTNVKMRALFRYNATLTRLAITPKRGFHLSTDTGPPPSENPVTHMRDYCKTLTQLSKSHGSRRLRDLYWQAKRARKSEFDRVIQQILIMVRGAGTKKVVFGIGDAKVKGWAGPFLEYLVPRLKSLGYNHIYYVSQYCPRCGSPTTLIRNSRHRGKRCSNAHLCNTYFHRDEMAGHNIANVLESFVRFGHRSVYLSTYRRRGQAV